MLIDLVLGAALAAAPDTPRFSGQGSLAPAPAASPDHRFEVAADLVHDDRGKAAERFQLNARLAPGGKAATAATTLCGTTSDALFNDGFE